MLPAGISWSLWKDVIYPVFEGFCIDDFEGNKKKKGKWNDWNIFKLNKFQK